MIRFILWACPTVTALLTGLCAAIALGAGGAPTRVRWVFVFLGLIAGISTARMVIGNLRLRP